MRPQFENEAVTSEHRCTNIFHQACCSCDDAGKSLARTGKKQPRKHVRDARDFNNIETPATINLFFFLQGTAPKEIHAILTEILACLLLGRAKDLSAPLYLWL